MILSLIKHSLRTFKRQKSHMIINMTGLAIGIASSVMISLYVIHELSYDRFNEKKDRIFRVNLMGKIGGQELNTWSTPSIMGPTMLSDFPEVESFLRLNGAGGSVVKIGERSFVEDDRIEADSTFFDFFSVPVLRGDSKKVLNAPYTVVLSQTAANRYFGSEDVLGRTMLIGNDTTLFTISGIMKDIPDNCHFRAEMITSFMTNPRSRNTEWLSNNRSTYVLLKPNVSAGIVDGKFTGLIEKYVGPELVRLIGQTIEDFLAQGNAYGFYLQPLTRIHLQPAVDSTFRPVRDPKSLLILASIAVLILIIAAINYMNLATAQASKRAREVGIRKVSGSTRTGLIGQFISESLILSLAALALALLIIALALPWFNRLLELQLSLDLFGKWHTLPALLGLAILIGLVSGIYPAFYLSRFNPAVVLKGATLSGRRNGKLRKVLVIFQFAVSIMLIVGSLVMFRQLRYLLNKDLGFNKENLMVVSNVNALGNQQASFKEVAGKIPGVRAFSYSTAVPGRNNNNNGYMMEGRGDETFLMFTSWADYDFLKTWGIGLSQGRYFEKDRGTDAQSVILNQAAIDAFRIADPLNQRVFGPGNQETNFDILPVIGITGNFHHESLHRQISPYIIRFRTENMRFGFASIRLDPANLQQTIGGIEKTWKEFTGNNPLQYYFVDEDLNRMYRDEKQNAQLALLFSLLAILIGTLGLFGMTSYTLAQRTREIGIRRTMGASVANIYLMISRETSVLVGIATLIAWSAVYFFLDKWLDNFQFKIGLSPVDFLAGFLIAFLIAVMTISYRTLKAANATPSVSLKYE